jgi:hypothetical protein
MRGESPTVAAFARPTASQFESMPDTQAKVAPLQIEPRDPSYARLGYALVVMAVIALGVTLRVPALAGTLVSDDWDHYAMVTHTHPVQLSPLDLFNFVPREQAARDALRSSGRLPWWSAPDIHLGFLRPLASALIWVDDSVLHSESSPERAHLHSLAWSAASVTGVAAVLGQILPLPAAALGVLFYAVDDALAIPVAWRASRSELIAITLMFWALASHLDWRRRRLARSRWLTLGLIWAGMLAGEYALALFAFFVACELVDGEAPLRTRWRPLVPLAIPPLLYLLVRASLGYGVRGSSYYIDPFTELSRYGRAVVIHLPLLAGDLGWGYAADSWFGRPLWRGALLELGWVPAAWLEREPLRILQWSLGFSALAAGSITYAVLGRVAKESRARSLRWLIVGALLALFPLASTLPMSRLTAGPSLAAHALFGWLLYEASRRLRSTSSARVRLGAAIVCASVFSMHGVHAAVRSRALAEHYGASTRIDARWIARAQIDDARLPTQHVFVLSAIDLGTQMSLPAIRRFHHLNAPLSSEALLPPVFVPFRVSRPSLRVLELSMTTPTALAELRTSAYRLAESDFEVHQRFEGRQFQTTVLAAVRGLPTQLRFEFERPLEDPSYVFLFPTPNGLRPFSLPAVGGTLELPPPAWPHPL